MEIFLVFQMDGAGDGPFYAHRSRLFLNELTNAGLNPIVADVYSAKGSFAEPLEDAASLQLQDVPYYRCRLDQLSDILNRHHPVLIHTFGYATRLVDIWDKLSEAHLPIVHY